MAFASKQEKKNVTNDLKQFDQNFNLPKKTLQTQTSNNGITEAATAVQINFEDEVVKDEPTKDEPTKPIQRTFETQTSNTFMDSNNVMTESETAV